MKCPECGTKLTAPPATNKAIKPRCLACGWGILVDKSPKSKIRLWDSEPIAARSLLPYWIGAIALLLTPYFAVCYGLLLIDKAFQAHGMLYPAEFVQIFAKYYWLGLLIYLPISALINPKPDIDQVEGGARFSLGFGFGFLNPFAMWHLLWMMLGLFLVPGKWFWIVLISTGLHARRKYQSSRE